MKLCKACGRKYADAMQMCPFCGAPSNYDPSAQPEVPAAAEPAPEPAPAAPPVVRPTPVPKQGMVVMGDAAVQKDPVRVPWLLLLILFGVAGAVGYSMLPKQLPYGQLEPWDSTAVFCKEYEDCAVLYVTPWCPACRNTLLMVQRNQERWAEEGIGVAVIIGNDDLERCREFGDFIGDIAFIDRGDFVLRRTEIDTVPTWFRVDGDRKVQGRLEGTFRPIDYTFEKLGFYEPGASSAGDEPES